MEISPEPFYTHFKDMRREKIKSGNIFLNLEFYDAETPEGVIIFLPGTGCPVSVYSPFLERLKRSGYTVVGMDYRGHGLSEGERGDFTVAEIMDDISSLLEFLKDRYRRKIGIMGSSQGGILALYALHDIEGLSFGICHNAVYLYEIKNYMPFYLRIFPQIFTLLLKVGNLIAPSIKIRTLHVNWRYVFDDRKKLKELFENPLFVKRYSLRALHSLFTYVPKNPEPRAPFLIIVGERERVVPNVFARKVKEKFPHLCDIVELKDAGHMLLIEYPERTLKEIEKWLSLIR